MEEFFDVLNDDGTFANRIASREQCHKEGLRHRGVVVFVINNKGQILLQQRSANKKLWPNLWDITAGGHALAGEFGFEATIREAKEEIGLDLAAQDLLFIGATTSTDLKGDIINNHFNEYYIAQKEIDISGLILQEEEVQNIRWFDAEELSQKIDNNFEDLTDKIECWKYLQKYLEHISQETTKESLTNC